MSGATNMSTASEPDWWTLRLPEMQAALAARHPNVKVACTLRKTSICPEPLQTVTFRGAREDLAFVPAQVFANPCTNLSDEHGDRWSALHHEEDDTWSVFRHSGADGSSAPYGARRWPQKSLEAQVGRVLRRAFSRPKERAGS